MGDVIADNVIVELVWNVLKWRGPLHFDAVCEHIGDTVIPRERVATAIGAHAGKLFGEVGGRWQTVPYGSDCPLPQPLTEPAPDRARRWRLGVREYAVLPDAAHRVLVRQILARGPQTSEALTDHLRGKGWRQIFLDDVILHLTHSDDFRLDHGLWSVTDEARTLPTPTAGRSEGLKTNGLNTTPSRFRERAVYITGKGAAYHWDPNCHLLRMGWAKALDDGMGATNLQETTAGHAINAGYHACRGCTATG